MATRLYDPTAVHAAFLAEQIASAEVARTLKSCTELVQNPMQYDAYPSVLHGVLNYYDLSDLLRRADGRIRFVD